LVAFGTLQLSNILIVSKTLLRITAIHHCQTSLKLIKSNTIHNLSRGLHFLYKIYEAVTRKFVGKARYQVKIKKLNLENIFSSVTHRLCFVSRNGSRRF